ncbi:putative receptor protein kinase [Nymphaea thermarum]|nr:putative receptor protein kinase [Nymphaea thermarum]
MSSTEAAPLRGEVLRGRPYFRARNVQGRGENAFSFAIWFSETLDRQKTVVWMANRDWPGLSVILRKRGDLALLDADRRDFWTTATTSAGTGEVAELWETGNLVLMDGERKVVWQSFDHPTDTLLPRQPLTRSLRLVSKAAEVIYTTVYYVAHFNVLSFSLTHPASTGPTLTVVSSKMGGPETGIMEKLKF